MRRLPEEGAGAEERSLWMPAKARRWSLRQSLKRKCNLANTLILAQ